MCGCRGSLCFVCACKGLLLYHLVYSTSLCAHQAWAASKISRTSIMSRMPNSNSIRQRASLQARIVCPWNSRFNSFNLRDCLEASLRWCCETMSTLVHFCCVGTAICPLLRVGVPRQHRSVFCCQLDCILFRSPPDCAGQPVLFAYSYEKFMYIRTKLDA